MLLLQLRLPAAVVGQWSLCSYLQRFVSEALSAEDLSSTHSAERPLQQLPAQFDYLTWLVAMFTAAELVAAAKPQLMTWSWQ